MMKTRDIHKAGRPPVIRPASFYETLLRDYETHSIRQLARLYGVCPQTISNWLKRAREVTAERNEKAI